MHWLAEVAAFSDVLPTGQLEHEVDVWPRSKPRCPGLDMYLPGSHCSQLVLPSEGWTVPRAQGSGCTLAAEQKWPMVQLEHWAAEARSVAFEEVPGGQGSGAAAPAGQ